MTMLHSIVIATDGSVESESARMWSESLARIAAADLSVVDVRSDPRSVAVDDVMTRADAVRADLVVIGSERDAGWTDRGFGSVARRAATHSTRPLAVIHDRAAIEPGVSIVVGVDGSEASAAALRWGHDLADVLGGTVTAVFVHDPLADSYPHPALDDWKYQGQLEAEQLVAEASASGGSLVSFVSRAGDVVSELVRTADELAPSIVVAGTVGHGSNPIRSMGKVRSELVESAGQPVVLVPAAGSAVLTSAPGAETARAADQNPARSIVGMAEDRLDAATAPSHARAYAATDAPASRVDLVVEQERETREAFGPVTRAQVHGVVYGGLAGAVIGAVVTFGLGFISWGASVAVGWRILACALVGAFAGATGGAVYWGGRLPELEGEVTSADNSPSASGSSLSDPRTDDRGR